MLPIHLHKHFLKDYAKQNDKVRAAFKKRRDLFLIDPHSPSLHTHHLNGEYAGCSSFNVTGDIRVIFEKQGDIYIFHRIGSHPELYG